MAKLNGVKTVAESIEYNGVRYEKSTEPAEVGDIVRMEEAEYAEYDVEEGAFYEVIYVDGDGDPEVVDDVGDEFNLWGEDYTVFKRIVPAPAAVQYREFDRAAKVGDREVKREARAGERIKIVDAECTFGDYENGDVLTVTKVEAAGVCTDGGWPYIFHEEYVVLEPTAEKYSVGDYVKIVGNSTDHGFSIGEIAQVTTVVGDGEIWRADHLDGSDWWLVNNEDVVRATPEEVAAAKADVARRKQFAPGDKVRLISGGGVYPLCGFDDGGTYEVTNPDYDHESGKKIEIRRPAGYHGYAKPDQLEKVTEDDLLKVGEYARVKDTAMADVFHKPGDIVRIVEDDRTAIPFKLESITGDYAGWARESDLVRATDEEVAAARDSAKWAKLGRKVGEIRKGDLVRVADGCGGKNRAGDVGDALGNGSVGSVRVGTKGNPTGEAGWCVVELVTPVEQRFDTPADAA